jgi:hypothetical protein
MIRRTRAGDEYRRRRGVTTVGLLPRHASINERWLIDFTLPAALALVRIRHLDDR